MGRTITVSRFFCLHFIVPFLVLGLIILHVVFLHSMGSNNPLGCRSKSSKLIFNLFIKVLGEGVLAEVLSSGGVKGGAVVVADVVVDGDCSHLHHRGQPVHLPYTFLTGEPCLWSSRCSSNERKEKSDPGHHPSYSCVYLEWSGVPM